MKILLAIIITATFSFGCAMLEGEQTTTDSGGGGTTSSDMECILAVWGALPRLHSLSQAQCPFLPQSLQRVLAFICFNLFRRSAVTILSCSLLSRCAGALKFDLPRAYFAKFPLPWPLLANLL